MSYSIGKTSGVLIGDEEVIVVHETQKLEDRPNNQEHTKWMLEAFATKFEIIDHGLARSGGKREYYHVKKI